MNGGHYGKPACECNVVGKLKLYIVDTVVVICFCVVYSWDHAPAACAIMEQVCYGTLFDGNTWSRLLPVYLHYHTGTQVVGGSKLEMGARLDLMKSS